jgi:hypothetical protein
VPLAVAVLAMRPRRIEVQAWAGEALGAGERPRQVEHHEKAA